MRKTAYIMYGIQPHRSGEEIWMREEMAEAQERKFRAAGYTKVVTEDAPALFTEDEMQAFLIIERRVVQIAKAPVVIKSAGANAGKAAVITAEHPPVIRVFDDLLLWQRIAVALFVVFMGVWPGALIAAIVMGSSPMPIEDRLPGLLFGGLVSAIIMIVIRPLLYKMMELGMETVGVDPKVDKSES